MLRRWILLFLLLLSASSWAAQVRVVSLVEGEPLQLRLGPLEQTLRPFVDGQFLSLPAGVHRLTLSSGSRRLLSREIGLASDDRYTLVLIGRRQAAPSLGWWWWLREHFEGQGASGTRGYELQIRCLRERHYLEAGRGYLRVLHAVPALVSLDLYSGRKRMLKGLAYSQLSPLSPRKSGVQTLSFRPHGSELDLLKRSVSFAPGRVTTLLIYRDPNGGQLRALQLSELEQQG